MKKLLGIFGNKTGLVSMISEHTGKISFRRSILIMIIAFAVKDATEKGLNNSHIALIIGVLIAYAAMEVAKAFAEKWK